MSQQPLSPEKYIRAKARSLPIEFCLINSKWQEHGLANIAVVRRHPKGTLTAGVFLVDIFCIGVKDCLYIFNKPEEEVMRLLKDLYEEEPLKEEYELVHNIIFNAVDFAASFQVSPNKKFQLCKYLLEPEDSIGFIETPTGDENGNPLFMTAKGYPLNIQVINKLQKHFGSEGFRVVYKEEMEALDIFDEYDDDHEEDE